MKLVKLFFSVFLPVSFCLVCIRENPLFIPDGTPYVSAGNDTTVSIYDTVHLVGEAFDPEGSIVQYEWNINNAGFVITSGIDTVITVPGIACSTFTCSLKVITSRGKYNTADKNIHVLLDPPSAAGSSLSTEASAADSIELHGSGKDAYGYIAKYEWDFGTTGAFTGGTIADSVIRTKTFSYPDTVFKCALRVTDDDGNQAADTVNISIVKDPPVPEASSYSPEASINDSVILKGRATDKYGYVTKYEWDPGNTGTFLGGTAADSLFKAKTNSGPNSVFFCVLRVTDDDGNQATDTVSIMVVADPPIPTATSLSQEASINDSIILKGRATDKYGYITKYEWDIGNNGVFIGGTTADSVVRVKTPLIVNSFFSCVLKVTDDDGNSALDTAIINIISDQPKVIFDNIISEASINDSVFIKGSAIDKYGYIARYLWDIGNTGVFLDYPSGSKVSVKLPSTPNTTYTCVLKAVDDDGEFGLDTMNINVVLDVPIVTALAQSSVVAYDSKVYLSGSVINKYGSIVKYEWNINNTGYNETLSEHKSFYANKPSYICSLRVTDEDNNTATDGVEIKVRNYQIVSMVANKKNVVNINDSILIIGSTKATPFDSIVKWEFDPGNTNSFVESNDSTLLFIAPSIPYEHFYCIVRVTSSEGFVWKGTVDILVLGVAYDIDGNKYHTVVIGTQTWMVENLKTTKYNDGTLIPPVPITPGTPAYCWCNNDSIKFADPFGALYNWYAVDTKKLAPIGFHVPTEAEWITLINYLGGESVAGGKLKEAGLEHWIPPNTGGTDNETNFFALPGGVGAANGIWGTYKYVGRIGFWWTSTNAGDGKAKDICMSYNNASVTKNIFYLNYQYIGMSVRCVKD